MTPERWQRIDKLFHSTLERPREERTAYLTQACGKDEAMRSEIEALIAAHECSGEFLDVAAYDAGKKELIELDHPAVGQLLGRYRIIGTLGSGGMGEVFLAEDPRLGRKIALKLLPFGFTKDRERVQRFEREARIASALSHPNICVIHEMGDTDDGRRFITMEYIEGITLRQRLSQKGMSLWETVDVSIQVASGLVAAHAAGIVHRDLKPENIMLREDGFVKVLDFGLAKLTERETDQEDVMRSVVKTCSGMIMGTVSYMSPEQARGLRVDARTDIWSLGILLYEMVVGRAPFAATTSSDMLVRILEHDTPAMSRDSGEVPAELERIVRRALHKDREQRYQTIKEMMLDLKSLQHELDVETPSAQFVSKGEPEDAAIEDKIAPTAKYSAGRTEETATTVPASGTAFVVSAIKRHQRLVALTLTGLIVGALAILFWSKPAGQKPPNPGSASLFQRMKVIKLTTNGNARHAAISPDGKYFAYVIAEAGKESLWIGQVAVAGNVRIVPPAEVAYQGLTFSPDGNYVYYKLTDNKGAAAIYKTPVLGQHGATIKVVRDWDSSVSLSPDGQQIAFVNQNANLEGEDRLLIAKTDGTGERVIAVRRDPDTFGFFSIPAWSPDGKTIACGVGMSNDKGYFENIAAIRIAEGTETLLSSERWQEIRDMTWLADGSGLLMNAKDEDESFLRVWLLPYPAGLARRITSDLSDYTGVSVTADSSAFVTVQRQTLSNIWIAPGKELDRAAQVTSGSGRYWDLSWSSDGMIAYASDASGSADIWEIGMDGQNQKQLTAGAGRNYAPVATEDGRYIVFHSNRGGTFNVWRIDRNGSNPTQLTHTKTEALFPEVSPDGQWVVYNAVGSHKGDSVWKVSINGGDPVELTKAFSWRPSVSPEGKLFACWYREEENSPWRIAVIQLEGGTPEKTFDVAPTVSANWDNIVRWTPDSRALTYIDHRGGISNVWIQPLEGGPPRQLTNFKSERIFAFDWSRTGQLLLSRGVSANDVIMISDAR